MQYIVQMSRSPIDAQALALGVAVEGLLNEMYAAIAPPSLKFIEEVDKVAAAVRDLDLSQEASSRIPGSLGVMKGTRAKDRLRVLVATNVISRKHYDAWEKLRNTSAHAAVHDVDNEFLSLYGTVLVLAYCLMFNSIGYSGPFTDYGTPGWPQKDYPFASSEEAAV